MRPDELADARAQLAAVREQFRSTAAEALGRWLRIYEPDELGADGYPFAWHAGVKMLVREQAGNRCERCGHPYAPGGGRWTPCAQGCTHGGEARYRITESMGWMNPLQITKDGEPWTVEALVELGWRVEASWRILTTHHLTGEKHDCRWWNLAALCQRCHLTIQGRVKMAQVWPHEHTAWMKPHAAGYYAAAYLGEQLSREQTEARLDELLALERAW